MTDKGLLLVVAKVIIAAAWADGEIRVEEMNSLKDVIFRLPNAFFSRRVQITGRDWAMLEMYLEAPVDQVERRRLVEELKAALRGPRDRKLALTALDQLAQTDGLVVGHGQAAVEEIKATLKTLDLGVFARLGRLVRGPKPAHTRVADGPPMREEHLEDFIKNKVFYAVRQRLNLDEGPLTLSERDWRKLSLAGGLMAHVANVDREITTGEFDAMVQALRANWDLTETTAAVVAEVALSEMTPDVDYFHLMREFFDATTENERVRFLDVLLAVAAADGQVSHDENEAIRSIARGLKLTHRQFAEAKLKIIPKNEKK